MNLTHLKYFVSAIETGSYSRAARLAGVTQPAISTAIKGLEEEFDAELIVRSKDGMELTATGQSLLENARKLLGDAGKLAEEIRQLKDLEKGTVSIGIRTHLMIDAIQEAVDAYMSSKPHIRIQIRTGQYKQLRKQLLDGELDLIVDHTSRQASGDVDIIVEPLFEDPFMVFMRPDHPESGQKSLDISIVHKYPHLYSSMIKIRSPKASAIVQDSGIHKNPPAVDIADQNILGALVANSRKNYVFVWTYRFFDNYVKDKKLVAIPLSGVGWSLPVSVSYRSERLLSPAAKLFIQTLKEVCSEISVPPVHSPAH